MADLTPINYGQYLPQADILGNFAKGIEIGDELTERKRQQQELQRNVLNRQRYDDLLNIGYERGYSTADELAMMATLRPEVAAQLNTVWQQRNEDQTRSTLQKLGQYDAAFLRGDIDTVKKMMSVEAQAANNSGDEEQAARLQAMIKSLDISPKATHMAIQQQLVTKMGPDAYGKWIAANTTQFSAQSAHDKRVADIEKGEKELELKITKEEREAQEAQDKLALDTKKYELDVDKVEADKLRRAEDKRQEQLKTESDLRISTIAFDDTLSTISDILNDPNLSRAVGTLDAVTPTMRPATRAFINKVDNLRSQAFMEGIKGMRGMGALSDAEGKKVQDSIANLSLATTEGEFKKQVRKIEERVKLLRTAYIKEYKEKYGVEPDLNIGLSPSTTDEDDRVGDDIRALLDKYKD